jgi:hypothetical protein
MHNSQAGRPPFVGGPRLLISYIYSYLFLIGDRECIQNFEAETSWETSTWKTEKETEVQGILKLVLGL